MAFFVADNIQAGTDKDQGGKLHPVFPERSQPDRGLQDFHSGKRFDPKARVLPDHYVLDFKPRPSQELQVDLARLHGPTQLPGEGSSNLSLPGIDLDEQRNRQAQRQQSRRCPEDCSDPMTVQHLSFRLTFFLLRGSGRRRFTGLDQTSGSNASFAGSE